MIPALITIIAKGRTTIDSRLKAYCCELCGYEGKDRKYEVHHVNKVKNLKGKEPWEVVMIAKRRKTLVVCHDCHQKIHHGLKNVIKQYNGEPGALRGARPVL